MTCFRITFFLCTLLFSGLSAQPCSPTKWCGNGPSAVNNIRSRVVGGRPAIKNSWPSMAAILQKNFQFCGGVLIDSIHVLSAAHCFYDMTYVNVTQLTVALGMHRLKPTIDAQLFKKVFRVTYHKEFDYNTFYNDIAILRLTSPVTFSPTISPVCLPGFNNTEMSEQYIGREATVIGWGDLKEKGNSPDVLQEVSVGIISNDVCNTRYLPIYPYGIADHMLCATFPGRDACNGDSGGPLLVQYEAKFDSPWVVVGIVSWGEGCAQEKYPGVYTRVSHFSDWIKRYTTMD